MVFVENQVKSGCKYFQRGKPGGSVAPVLPDAQKCTLELIPTHATITQGQFVYYTSCRKHGIVSIAVKFVVSTQIVVSGPGHWQFAAVAQGIQFGRIPFIS